MTARQTYILLIILMCSTLIRAQSADDLRAQLKTATSDTARARLSGALAWELKFTYNDEAWALANEELKLAKDNPLLLADAYRTKALIRVIQNKLSEGMELYGLAIDNARKAKSDFYEASCYSLMAGMYQDLGDYDRSLQYYFDGLKVAERGHESRMIGTISNNIATVYGSMDRESELSLRYYKRALVEAGALKLYAFAELITANMASEYMLIGKKDSVEIMIAASMDFARLSGKRNYEYASSLASIGEIYGQLGKTKQAEANLLEAITVMDSIKRPMNVLMPISALCKLYIRENKMAEAEKLDDRLLSQSQEYKAKVYIRDGYKYKSDIAHHKGQDALALKYYEQFNAWDDSVSNDVKQQSIANVQSRADLAQKDLEVQYHTKKKTEENQILKLQNSNLRLEIIAVAVILLILLLLAFFIWRVSLSRQKLNLELTQKNAQIERQSKEKDTLMLEIHHRVKNNLQIVSSLLNLQANSMKDESAVTALRESQNRVKSIALIHQKLYAREELSAILLEEYIRELCTHLKSVFNADHITIRTSVHPPHLRLDMDTSIPLGVILNELITNSIKYAQINKAGGVIDIKITDHLDGTCVLQYADNGIGLPEGYDLKTSGTLGMRIVTELARQMKGTFTSTANQPGASFTLTFPLTPTKK